MSEAELINESDDLAEAALTSFESLDFLYSMLFPRDIGPSRLSNGQNRALRTRQPDRRCAWDNNEHCLGIVDAAHIKADRLGGLAVPNILIWLCQSHHRLLDVYLRARMSIDHESRRIVARVISSPPPESKASGLPLTIWDAIEDKGEWTLPLRPESIAHIFDETRVPT